jgi:thioredoxin reductase/pSer/pThr/pTyr-binding forkhead associated (FHA) protein/ferredoxin
MNTPPEILPDGTLVLNQPVKLPEILDVLIVGGGPTGTGAAFRAKELGLSALVIDFDDLMKEIRDFAKGKPVKPDYGGGDKMKFPKGGNLISLLHFQEMDKDEMVALWKGYYREHNIPAQVGVELTGLERWPDGIWQAKAYNANTKSDQFYPARHVVIGIGCGAPRRLDIPGNIKDIAYRLADATLYVGGPVLVTGGGTSAAEAVIAISNAKSRANDPTAVYWSYRSDKLPKVSKALAEEFFAASLDNGNIRHYPASEPITILAGDDRKEYLSVRTDRRIMPGRPCETVHAEFPLGFCIACIGQEIPEKFLNGLGIQMAAGPGGKKRILATPWLETQQPNVYLIGSILGQAYYETDDFNADPSTYRQVKHAGNIKSALIDGVLVTEVIAQKLAGKTNISVTIDFQEEAAKPEPKPVTLMQTIVEASGAPLKERAEPVRAAEERFAYLVRIVAGNEEEEEFRINQNGITTIGRTGCDLNFPDDAFLSDRHASISHGSDGYFLRDDGAATGVFLKLKEARPLEVIPGNIVRLGRQFLVFRADNGSFSFIHFDQTGKQINRYSIPEKTIVLGREAPDITLDGKDMTLSRRHLSITRKENKVFIKDLGSANGSYLKVKNTIRLEPDDQFRAGQQLFKFSLQEEVKQRTVVFSTLPPIAAPPPAKPEAPASAPPTKAEAPVVAKPEGMVVVFKNLGKSFAFKPGQTICEIAEKNGVKLKADCHIGSCGIDPIRILSGIENMSEPSDEEKGTLEDINGLKAGEYRLACVAKPKGPVVVEVLEQ